MVNVSQAGNMLSDSLSGVYDVSFFTSFLRVFIKSRIVIDLLNVSCFFTYIKFNI